MPGAASLDIDDLDFDLPPGLVAQHPAAERGGSRLMVLEAGRGEPVALGRFDELLLEQLSEDDLVIANDARVMHARIPVERSSGGHGELLLLRPDDSQPDDTGHSTWIAMARPARRYRPATEVATTRGDARIGLVERTGAQTWLVDLPCALDGVPAWLLAHGELPLPPYITERGQDEARYQTVHARADGSVAAPTAGLHFDEQLWERIARRCEVAHLTLHVGAGTFLPISTPALAEHVMHHERYEVPPATDRAVRDALAEGGRVVAVGTTSTRVLEHVYGDAAAPLSGSTDLFILPGHRWACVGALLTNFHLPRSTLVALVMAFHGVEATRRSYRCAVEQRMRFYSFGDAMFVHGPAAGSPPR